MEICIVVSSDNTYAKHLGVMLYSLLNTADSRSKFDIYVLDGGINKSNLDKISKLVEAFGSTIHFIYMDKKVYEKYPVNNHFKPSVYYRLSMQYLISPTYRKVIYLDCDMIILDDISKLWMIDFSDHILAAVEDSGFENNDRLFMPNNTLYFNAGVLLINMDKWREADISGKAHNFIHEYPERLLLADQDVLNAVICGNWQLLHPRWNQQTKMLRSRHPDASFSECELTEALQFPGIVHFTESSKPWHYMNEHPYQDEYYKLLQCTEWKYRFPKTHKFINSKMKSIVGSAYKLLDIMKMFCRTIVGICNSLHRKKCR